MEGGETRVRRADRPVWRVAEWRAASARLGGAFVVQRVQVNRGRAWGRHIGRYGGVRIDLGIAIAVEIDAVAHSGHETGGSSSATGCMGLVDKKDVCRWPNRNRVHIRVRTWIRAVVVMQDNFVVGSTGYTGRDMAL